MARALLPERKAADLQLKEEIGGKTSEWGVSAVSVEIRDVAIPAQLQDAMSRQATKERGSTVLIPSSRVDSLNVPGVIGLTSPISPARGAA